MATFSLRQWKQLHQSEQPCHWIVVNHETNQSMPFNFKHDAHVYQKSLPHSTLYFHWYEKEFARLDLSKEPVESHAELCRQRAQELRDTYKYLRLSFSAGSDSLTALRSFLDNNIHLDEIVVVDYFDGSNYVDPLESAGREIKLYALPYLKEIAGSIPNTKITVINSTPGDADKLFGDFSNAPEEYPTFDSMEGQLHFGIESWALSKYSGESEHEDCCDIHGGSKVKIFKNKNKWYFYFIDSAISDINMTAANGEDFFISKNIPKLYLKTVYLLKNFYISQKFDDTTINNFYNNPENHPAFNAGMGRHVAPGLAAFKTYASSHNALEWKNHFMSGWHSMMFFKNVVNTPEGEKWIKNYQRNIMNIIEISSDEWNIDKLGNPVPALGRRGHYSKFYCLNDGLAYDSTQAKQNGPDVKI